MKKFRFEMTKLNDDENLIKINYIDSNYFKESYIEEWLYNGIYFNVERVKGKSIININTKNNKVVSVFLYLGNEDTHLIVDNKTLKILKDLRDKVYDIKDNSIKNYLKEFYINYYYYYYVDLDFRSGNVKVEKTELYYYIDSGFELYTIDKKLFSLGNMFSTRDEAKKYLEILLNTKVKDIKDVFKEQRIFLNNMKEKELFYE